MSAAFFSLLFGPPSYVFEDVLWEHCDSLEGSAVSAIRPHADAWGRADCVFVTCAAKGYAETLARLCGPTVQTIPLARIDTLRKGDRFRSFAGTEHVYDHHHHGCCYTADGEVFAGCAHVEILK